MVHGADGVNAGDVSSTNGIPIQGMQLAVSTTSWTSATALNTTNTISVSGLNTVTVAMANTSTMTNGVLTFEVSPDSGTTWFAVSMARIDSYTVENTYTLNTVANRAWSTSVDGFTNFRVRLSTVITGTGTASVFITAQVMPIEPIVTVGQSTAALLNATVTGTVTATPSGVALGVAEDAALSGNALRSGIRAHSGVPTAMSADNDIITPWADRSGAQTVIPQPRQVDLQGIPTLGTVTDYTSGDYMGTNITFTGAALATGRGGQVISAMLLDRAIQSVPLTLLLFRASPTVASADNALLSITAANASTARYLGTIKFSAGDYVGATSASMCPGELLRGPISFVTSGSANIFGVLVAGGTYNAAAAGDIEINLVINQF